MSEPPKHRNGLRDSLVAQGRALFEESGVAELSLRALARRLDVSPSAPFKHFAGKEELLAAIAASGFAELRDERLQIAAQETDAFSRAQGMMHSYIRYARSHERLFQLMLGPRLIAFRDGEYGQLGLESFGLFADSVRALALAHGWPESALDPLAHTAWGLEHGVASLLLAGVAPQIGSSLDVDGFVQFSVDFLLRAIQAGPPTGARFAPAAQPGEGVPRRPKTKPSPIHGSPTKRARKRPA